MQMREGERKAIEVGEWGMWPLPCTGLVFRGPPCSQSSKKGSCSEVGSNTLRGWLGPGCADVLAWLAASRQPRPSLCLSLDKSPGTGWLLMPQHVCIRQITRTLCVKQTDVLGRGPSDSGTVLPSGLSGPEVKGSSTWHCGGVPY
ncbi:hypothetical protein Cadr_000027693 [Camelus dromedarius]|uniref:Uncharacterized protein n=1 Tax=Camelus dromedarius TaxID=9838 RepID=A0A5N4CBC7_CAMDR|nr:hypothetical protein Cadr_000027693 [Camelus dromedarius]